MKLYMSPTQPTNQTQFVPLTSDNWHATLAKAKTNYCKQKTFDGPLVVHLPMYASKEVKQSIRRATPALIEKSAAAIYYYLTEHPTKKAGFIQAHQPEGAEATLPDNATCRQTEHFDAIRSTTKEKCPE
ncbi:hypothetical protein PHPALM_5864 [Phytophthora palmivora]|uniref:Uncharacterized protein n=1 Tax=Phytophthora palmivora TaxID=4796 RepID=A0A2P4YGB7_9STRA|nr:hypothetical protein PHPALM_5864 [Phytophthora palmivora]